MFYAPKSVMVFSFVEAKYNVYAFKTSEVSLSISLSFSLSLSLSLDGVKYKVLRTQESPAVLFRRRKIYLRTPES